MINGKRLKELIEDRGFRMDGFARQVGISRASLHGYIAGRRNPRRETIKLMADRLGVSVADLMQVQQAA